MPEQPDIDKANQAAELERACQELIRLFEVDEWRITAKAETDGRRILREKAYGQPTQWGLANTSSLA